MGIFCKHDDYQELLEKLKNFNDLYQGLLSSKNKEVNSCKDFMRLEVIFRKQAEAKTEHYKNQLEEITRNNEMLKERLEIQEGLLRDLRENLKK